MRKLLNSFYADLDVDNEIFDRQNSAESNTSEVAPLVPHHMPPRPSIVIDSSQLPIQNEVLKKNGSKDSLHMQSETMC